eukprot:366557-Chlamydomonas_euryale.AAC.3
MVMAPHREKLNSTEPGSATCRDVLGLVAYLSEARKGKGMCCLLLCQQAPAKIFSAIPSSHAARSTSPDAPSQTHLASSSARRMHRTQARHRPTPAPAVWLRPTFSHLAARLSDGGLDFGRRPVEVVCQTLDDEASTTGPVCLIGHVTEVRLHTGQIVGAVSRSEVSKLRSKLGTLHGKWKQRGCMGRSLATDVAAACLARLLQICVGSGVQSVWARVCNLCGLGCAIFVGLGVQSVWARVGKGASLTRAAADV